MAVVQATRMIGPAAGPAAGCQIVDGAGGTRVSYARDRLGGTAHPLSTPAGGSPAWRGRPHETATACSPRRSTTPRWSEPGVGARPRPRLRGATPTRSTSPPRRRCAPIVAAVIAADRPRRRRAAGAGRHRDHPRGRGPGGRAGRSDPGRLGRGLSGLGDAAARAALAAQRHGRSPAGRAAPAGPSRTSGPRAGRGRAGPVGAAAAAQGSRRPGAGRAAHRRHRRSRRGGPPAGRHRVRPHRPGHQARRVRGPRRHSRRLPADRGAPAAGGVLGRRDRGDPHLRRGRPAHHGHGRPAVGAAVPGAAADRRGTGSGPRTWRSGIPSWPRCWTSWPPASRSRAWSRSRPRCWTASNSLELRAALHAAAAAVVLLCDPERIRTRAHDLVRTSEEFLQASWAAAAGGGKAPVDLGRGRVPDRWPRCGRRPAGWASRGGR